jgi:sterol desaturase/sphingolipid hydroxylase (fatty acid hydroxylase superfamily)
VAVTAPVAWLIGGRIVPSCLTAITLAAIGLAHYEWTHLLVHTAYRPRTRYYARLDRNHRRHHYRNEHYWLGVTSNLGDRIMRTLPAADNRDRHDILQRIVAYLPGAVRQARQRFGAEGF